MILIKIDWSTVIVTTLSTLIVGVILAGYGYIIWKKQFFYQKRLEVYAELMPLVSELKSNLHQAFEMAGSGFSNKHMENNILALNQLIEKFNLYFSDTERKPIDKLIKLLSSHDILKKYEMNEQEFNRYVEKQYKEIVLLKDKLL